MQFGFYCFINNFDCIITVQEAPPTQRRKSDIDCSQSFQLGHIQAGHEVGVSSYPLGLS
jgi:hypothetical protein